MKSIIRLMLGAAVLCIAASIARAQDQPPPYEKGPVWTFTEIKTKTGHFDEYMRWLDTTFKAESEASKAAGRLLDYKIFLIPDPRQNEGDIYIARLYPNMAAFDHSTAEDFALSQKVLGSVAKADEANAARGSIREILSQTLAREVTLK